MISGKSDQARNQLDRSDRLYLPMTRTIKAALLFGIFVLCALGVIFSPQEKPQNREQRTHVVPVNNRQPQRTLWLRV